jgi:hypothetical protein
MFSESVSDSISSIEKDIKGAIRRRKSEGAIRRRKSEGASRRRKSEGASRRRKSKKDRQLQ